MQAVTDMFSARTLIIILVISIVLNAFLLYRLFNTALSLDYSRTEQSILKTRANRARAIIEYMLTEYSKKDLEKIAAEFKAKGVIVKSTPSEIQIDDIVFTVADKKVTAVNFIGSSE